MPASRLCVNRRLRIVARPTQDPMGWTINRLARARSPAGPYAAAALMGVWSLQAVVVPLLPRAAEIPDREFKVKLAQGQITDVALGTPIKA
jgi:hypothetical protein